AVCDLHRQAGEGHSGRRAAGGKDLSQRGPEHDGLVRTGGGAMKTLKGFTFLFAAVLMAAVLPGAARADIASGVVRSNVAGIDLIIYRTGVKDVVTMAGSLPAGDVFAGQGNVAVPTLVGMMLDKGTTKQDQFQ